MENKPIALVTGASRGIGAAIARRLAKRAHTIATYNSAIGELQTLADAGHTVIQADISDPLAIDKLHDLIRDRFHKRLDILVNNAGISLDNPLLTATLDEFDRTVSVNMRGTWYTCKKMSRLLMRSATPRLINISSVIGSTGNPAQSVYGMTKAAIDNLTRTLAAELAPQKILVNSIAPGFIATDMTDGLPAEVREIALSRIPLGRYGTPEDVAEVAEFLAFHGTYITGAVIPVNGGMYG